METQQIAQLSRVFELLDKDTDGFLKQSDFRHIFAAFMIRLSEDDIGKIQKTLSNGNSSQSFDAESFGTILSALHKVDITAAVAEGWSHLNQQSLPFVSTDQISDFILKLGLPVSEREIKELVMQYDARRKGGLAYEEFTSMLT